MQNYKVKVIPGVGDAAPTATVEKRTTGQAVGDAITTLISDDEGTVGYVGNITRVGLVYGVGALPSTVRPVRFPGTRSKELAWLTSILAPFKALWLYLVPTSPASTA